jgi:hypothetical protein
LAQDVGAVAQPGSTTFDGSAFRVRASGADIWGTSDQFHFVYRTLSSDGTIVARVAVLQASHEWTKAALMIRGSLGANSLHASVIVSGGNGVAYQRRTISGGTTTHTDGGSGAPPAWLRMTRTGNVIQAFRSDDGVSWTLIGGDTFSTLPTNVYVGLAVTSHDNAVLTTAVFDGVSVVP